MRNDPVTLFEFIDDPKNSSTFIIQKVKSFTPNAKGSLPKISFTSIPTMSMLALQEGKFYYLWVASGTSRRSQTKAKLLLEIQRAEYISMERQGMESILFKEHFTADSICNRKLTLEQHHIIPKRPIPEEVILITIESVFKIILLKLLI